MAAISVFALVVFVLVLRAVKFADFPGARPVPVADVALATVFVGLERALAAHTTWGAPALAVGALLFLFGLWLDAALFAIFTIELGWSDLVGIVLSIFYPEYAGTDRARAFFTEHRGYLVLPAVAASALAAPWAERALSSGASLALGGLAALSAGLALFWTPRARGPRALSLDVRRSTFVEFIRARRPKTPPSDAGLALGGPARAPKSAFFGRLEGASIVLVTLESVGVRHVFGGGGPDDRASTPFLDALLRSGVRAREHVSPSPTTNNAHIALYASDYLESLAPGVAYAPAELAAAGYQTVYLTSATTAHYGLGRLLARAGFEAVLDAPVLRASGAPTWPPDQVLLGPGLERLAELRSDSRRPLFLHVHLSNTHVPYRVLDTARFRRRAGQGDLGRFLDALEETDHLLAELFTGLEARGLVERPLVAVSGDHGQSFGRFGYHGHGSAVVADQVMVPFVVAHPALAPAERPRSSHFDVMPTLLDLVGVEADRPTLGRSIFRDERPEALLLWAGHPSRASTSNFGLLRGEHKVMIDLAVDQGLRMRWDDAEATPLSAHEKAEWTRRLGAALEGRGLR